MNYRNPETYAGLLLASLAIAALLSSCSHMTPDRPPIIGVWEGTAPQTGVIIELRIEAGGTCMMSTDNGEPENGRWFMEDGRTVVVIDDESTRVLIDETGELIVIIPEFTPILRRKK